jgi:hypothetical protein
MSISRPVSLAVLALVGPLFVVVACGGGTPDPKTSGGGGETVPTSPEPTPVPVASTTATATDDDGDVDSIPTADVVCKHLDEVLKGKAGALGTCITELQKKQTDDVNYYVCYAGCSMAATTADAAEACKTKCKK